VGALGTSTATGHTLKVDIILIFPPTHLPHRLVLPRGELPHLEVRRGHWGYCLLRSNPERVRLGLASQEHGHFGLKPFGLKLVAASQLSVVFGGSHAVHAGVSGPTGDRRHDDDI